MKPDLILIFLSIMATYLILFGMSNYANKKNSFKLFSLSGWAKEIPILFLMMIFVLVDRCGVTSDVDTPVALYNIRIEFCTYEKI